MYDIDTINMKDLYLVLSRNFNHKICTCLKFFSIAQNPTNAPNTHVDVGLALGPVDAAAVVVARVGLGPPKALGVGAAAQQVPVQLVRVAEDLGRHDRSIAAQCLSRDRGKEAKSTSHTRPQPPAPRNYSGAAYALASNLSYQPRATI